MHRIDHARDIESTAPAPTGTELGWAACAFEWAGVRSLTAGSYLLTLGPRPRTATDLVVVRSDDGPRAWSETLRRAVSASASLAQDVRRGGVVAPGDLCWRVPLGDAATTIELAVAEPGDYAIFTGDRPDGGAIGLRRMPRGEPEAGRRDRSRAGAAGIELPGEVRRARLCEWLAGVKSIYGDRLSRVTCVLAIEEVERRYVFDVDALRWELRPDRRWNGAERRSSLVCAGDGAAVAALVAGFAACVKP